MMHAFFTLAFAHTEEELNRASQKVLSFPISSDDDFKLFAGNILVASCELYNAAKSGITNDTVDMSAFSKLMNAPEFASMLEFGVSQMNELDNKKMPYNSVVVGINKKFENIVDIIDTQTFEFYGGKLKFKIDPSLDENIVKKAWIE